VKVDAKTRAVLRDAHDYALPVICGSQICCRIRRGGALCVLRDEIAGILSGAIAEGRARGVLAQVKRFAAGKAAMVPKADARGLWGTVRRISNWFDAS
jgi:hypothetical protein